MKEGEKPTEVRNCARSLPWRPGPPAGWVQLAELALGSCSACSAGSQPGEGLLEPCSQRFAAIIFPRASSSQKCFISVIPFPANGGLQFVKASFKKGYKQNSKFSPQIQRGDRTSVPFGVLKRPLELQKSVSCPVWQSEKRFEGAGCVSSGSYG